MIEAEDYKEPRCPLWGGANFYNFDPKKQQGHIPMENIIGRLDAFLNAEKYEDGIRLLKYWIAEARLINDRHGELSLQSELMGLSRRTNNEADGLDSVWRGFELIEELSLQENTSAGTIWLNGATTLKAFGHAEESIKYYEKALELFTKNLKEDDGLFGGLYNNFALACVDIGQFERAENYYNKAVKIMKKQENGDLEVAITYLNMAEMYELTLDDPQEKTDEMCEAAYECLNNEDLPRDGYYAFVCRKCAPTFDYFGYFVIKEELTKRADDIYAGA